MRRALWLPLLALLAACSESPNQMLETARFEEQQGNRPHAAQLYRQIVGKHPGTPEAAAAQERLKLLEK